jgi:hypothetical protein
MTKGNVTPLYGSSEGYPLRRRLSDGIGQSTVTLEERGVAATGAVWVVMDDTGNYHASWDASLSALPARALVGMALTALMKVGS